MNSEKGSVLGKHKKGGSVYESEVDIIIYIYIYIYIYTYYYIIYNHIVLYCASDPARRRSRGGLPRRGPLEQAERVVLSPPSLSLNIYIYIYIHVYIYIYMHTCTSNKR